MNYEEFCKLVDTTDWDELIKIGLMGLARTLHENGVAISDPVDGSVALRVEDAYGWLNLHRGIVHVGSSLDDSIVLVILRKHLYKKANGFPLKVVIAQSSTVVYDPKAATDEWEGTLDEDWETDPQGHVNP